MNEEQRQQYERFPSHLTQALSLCAPRLAQAIPNLANSLRASGLDAKIREGAILRVAALTQSAFERMQHLDEVRKKGWTDADIAAIERGDALALPPSFAPLLGFVDELVAGTRVSDAMFAMVRAQLSDRDVATLVLLVGHYLMMARFLDTLDIELDAAPSRWDREH
jgi:alkylhydroperoxidase family enzyme